MADYPGSDTHQVDDDRNGRGQRQPGAAAAIIARPRREAGDRSVARARPAHPTWTNVRRCNFRGDPLSVTAAGGNALRSRYTHP